MKGPKREYNALRPPPHTQKTGVKYKRTSEANPKVFQFSTPVADRKLMEMNITWARHPGESLREVN